MKGPEPGPVFGGTGTEPLRIIVLGVKIIKDTSSALRRRKISELPQNRKKMFRCFSEAGQSWPFRSAEPHKRSMTLFKSAGMRAPVEIELKIRTAGMIMNHEEFQKIFHRFPGRCRALQKPGECAGTKPAEMIHPERDAGKPMRRIDIEIPSRKEWGLYDTAPIQC